MVSYPKDWRNRELSEVIHSYINGTSLERFFTKQVGKKVISLGNYSEDGKYIDDGIRVQENNKTSRYIVEKDDLCMVLNDKGNGRLVGRVILIDESNKYIFNQRSLRLVLDRDLVYPVFLHQYINSSQFRKNLKSCIQGNTQVYINPPSVMKLTINIPDYVEEQQAIADALTAFDTHISNLSKLIEKKKMIRDGAVEDLVSGKRGLAGFSGKWEECELSKIADIFDGTHQTPKYTLTGVPFVSVENITNIYNTDKFISKKNFELEFKNIPEKGDILMTRIGDIGTASIVTRKSKFAYYVSLALFKHIKINSEFLLYYIHSSAFQKELFDRSLNFAIPKKINKGEIGKCNVNFPTDMVEQQAIADILTAMDKEIADFEKEKEKYMALKAGAMDDLLTGKIRLV